jgi:hypothetical protein
MAEVSPVAEKQTSLRNAMPWSNIGLKFCCHVLGNVIADVSCSESCLFTSQLVSVDTVVGGFNSESD